jgi:8-oxo-dGTP pyrophosphatase MutT (NUDIX family)
VIDATPSDYRPPAGIRVVVVALIVRPRRPALFVSEFPTAPGSGCTGRAAGGIDFGETSAVALRREFAEEFATQIEVGPRLAVWENIFAFNDAPGQEWIAVHEASFCDERFLTDGRWPVRDAPTDIGVWQPLTGAHGIPLFPEGLLDLVTP